MRHTHVKQQIRWDSGGLGRFERKTPDTNAKARIPQATRSSSLLGALVIAVYDKMLERSDSSLP
jgi:hypothetical protein